jgi:hypothetical protein
MFFGLSFQFRAILVEFDAQDGLRKLYNVVSCIFLIFIYLINNKNQMHLFHQSLFAIQLSINLIFGAEIECIFVVVGRIY